MLISCGAGSAAALWATISPNVPGVHEPAALVQWAIPAIHTVRALRQRKGCGGGCACLPKAGSDQSPGTPCYRPVGALGIVLKRITSGYFDRFSKAQD